MADYVQTITNLSNQLAAMSSPFSDIDLFYCTLGGLGPDYEYFITTISLQANDHPFEELCSLLQSHELRLASIQSETPLLPPLLPPSSLHPFLVSLILMVPFLANLVVVMEGIVDKDPFPAPNFGSILFSWFSKKQPTVSHSSTESEYRSLAFATAELSLAKMLLLDLGISLSHFPTLYCDNKSVVALPAYPVFHARSKHIEIDYHFVRDKVLNKLLVVKFVSIEDQLVEIFTKALSSPLFPSSFQTHHHTYAAELAGTY